MIHILVGSLAIKDFQNENWLGLETSILENQSGDIIGWDKTDSVVTLLDMLNGWQEFIPLSIEDLKSIETNTKIQIDWGDVKTYTITKENFLNWYYEDNMDETRELKEDLAEKVLLQLKNTGISSITIENIFEGCNTESIPIMYLEEFKKDGYNELEVGDLDPCKINLID